MPHIGTRGSSDATARRSSGANVSNGKSLRTTYVPPAGTNGILAESVFATDGAISPSSGKYATRSTPSDDAVAVDVADDADHTIRRIPRAPGDAHELPTASRRRTARVQSGAQHDGGLRSRDVTARERTSRTYRVLHHLKNPGETRFAVAATCFGRSVAFTASRRGCDDINCAVEETAFRSGPVTPGTSSSASTRRR
jgi:hypothetical protein